MRLYFLGPPKTFSEVAAKAIAKSMSGTVEMVPMVTLEEVARTLSSDGSSSENLAVLPYYNYLEGLVQECLDLLYEYKLTIVGARSVAIELALGKHPQATIAARVLSHPKALAQCSDYLRQSCPGLALTPSASTTAAAATVHAEKADHAIASRAALEEYGLQVIADNIGNRRHGRQNFTEFFVASPQAREPLAQHARCHTLLAVTPNEERPGILAEILNQVAYYQVNISKIHSRPALERTNVSIDTEPQMFYLDVVAHPASVALRKCVDALRYRFGTVSTAFDPVRVVGSFVEPKLS